MRRTNMPCGFRGRMLGLLAVLGLSLAGLGQTDFSGYWNSAGLATPSRLRLLVDHYIEGEPSMIGFVTLPEFGFSGGEAFTVTADGHFTGPAFDASGNVTGIVSGTVSLASPGLVKVEAPGVLTNHFPLNAAADVMVSLKTKAEGSQQELQVLLRAPTYSNGVEAVQAGLVGNWNLVIFRTPRQLFLHLGSTNVDFSPTPLTGVVSVGGADEFAVRTGTLSVAPDGSCVVDVGLGPMPGTAQPTIPGGFPPLPPGMVNVYLTTPFGPDGFTLYINRSLDVMAGIRLKPFLSGEEDNYQELILCVRAPESQTLAGGMGFWRGSVFATPARLSQPLNQFGFIRGIPETNGFAHRSELLHAGHAGVFTLPASSGVGVLAITGPGRVTATGTNYLAEPQVWSTPLAINAGQNVMVAMRNDGAHELILHLRAPSERHPTTGLEPGVAEFGLTLLPAGPDGLPAMFWASAPNRQLLQSADLTTWTAVPGTAGNHQFPLVPTAAKDFYRVQQSGP